MPANRADLEEIVRALFRCVAFAPPLCATTEDIDHMVGILEGIWPEAEARFAGA